MLLSRTTVSGLDTQFDVTLLCLFHALLLCVWPHGPHPFSFVSFAHATPFRHSVHARSHLLYIFPEGGPLCSFACLGLHSRTDPPTLASPLLSLPCHSSHAHCFSPGLLLVFESLSTDLTLFLTSICNVPFPSDTAVADPPRTFATRFVCMYIWYNQSWSSSSSPGQLVSSSSELAYCVPHQKQYACSRRRYCSTFSSRACACASHQRHRPLKRRKRATHVAAQELPCVLDILF